MKIELDMDLDEAIALRNRLLVDTTGGEFIAAVASDIVDVLDNAIANENERRGVEAAERALEDGGCTAEDSASYRQSILDAGRGHLLR
jgi:hypothetical protein